MEEDEQKEYVGYYMNPFSGHGMAHPTGHGSWNMVVQGDMLEEDIYSPSYIRNKEEWASGNGGTGGGSGSGDGYSKTEADIKFQTKEDAVADQNLRYTRAQIDAILTRYYTQGQVDALLSGLSGGGGTTDTYTRKEISDLINKAYADSKTYTDANVTAINNDLAANYYTQQAIRDILDAAYYTRSELYTQYETNSKFATKAELAYQDSTLVQFIIDKVSYMEGVNVVNSLVNVPITKQSVIANLSGDSLLSFGTLSLKPGQVMNIQINPSADFTLTLPATAGWINMGEATVAATTGQPIELNIWCTAKGIYSIKALTPSVPIVRTKEPIIYEYNGGDAPATPNPSEYAAEDLPLTISNWPEKLGYEFTGWSGNGIIDPVTEITVPEGTTGALYYQAQWKIEEYLISYNWGIAGGVPVYSYPTTYTVEQTVTLPMPKNINPTAYRWDGWTRAGETERITQIEAGTTGTVSLEAHWVAKEA